MPSDVLKTAGPSAATDPSHPSDPAQAVGEPPSVKLIVRLFVIPLFIVAVAVGVMFLISLLAGGTPSMEESLDRLKNAGGNRTAGWLVGPASKQRYMDAKTLADKMKAGVAEGDRVKLADDLINILRHRTSDDEGEIRHFLLLALGRVWQNDPTQPPMNSEPAAASRRRVLETLSDYSSAGDARVAAVKAEHARWIAQGRKVGEAEQKQERLNPGEIATRKAALLATVYLAGRPEVRQALPLLVAKLAAPAEDVDVRIAAATALGPVASPDDREVIDALHSAIRNAGEYEAELGWSAALSLAQLGQADVAPTILKLLNRGELAETRYYDRESDPDNPAFRPLNDQEQQRILINTMIGARRLAVPEVQDQLRKLAESDPSPRVRAAGRELLAPRPAPAP
jgi:hypothetical protein